MTDEKTRPPRSTMVVVRLVVLAVAVAFAVLGGSWGLWVAFFLAFAALLLPRRATSFVPDPRFTEPGERAVVIVTTGPKVVRVIRTVRETTGAELLDAKERVRDGGTAADGLSEASARAVAERLEVAGARTALR